jgi:homogentisate 1,2-dioxygenase
MVAEHTFRPPYYHRNIMSEYMGLIVGAYDAKEKGFVPGGATLHNCMSAHGPDSSALDKAQQVALSPERYRDTMAFMFESLNAWHLTEFALNTQARDKNYKTCWQGIPNLFQR